MEHSKGLERQLMERVEAMRREQLQNGEVHLDPDPVASAEPSDLAPSDFGKAS